MRISQVADLLGIHPKTIRRWEKQGKFFPQRTLGNQRRFSQKDVHQLEQIKSGSPPAGGQPIDRLLTVEQAAEKLKVSPATIKRWTKEGKLTSYSESQINQLGQVGVGQGPSLSLLPTKPPLQFSPYLLYSGLAGLILALGLAIYLYLNRPDQIASPSIEELNLAKDVQVALPRVANFLEGRITIGADTGDLAFLDQRGNFYLKNSALIEGGVYTNSLQLLPAKQPENQIGRFFVDESSGNLLYFDGLEWVSLNQAATGSASWQALYDSGQTSLTALANDLNLTLGDLTASTSATSLRITLAGPQSQFKILGGAGQELLTVNDDVAYPILLNQPTKIMGNLYLPKLLDSDNESYWLDPSSTTVGLSLAGEATISATLKFSKYGEYITNTLDDWLVFSGGLGVGGSSSYGFSTSARLNAKQGNFEDNLTTRNLKIRDNLIEALNDSGIQLYDNGSAGLVIEDGGYVGIGTTNPTDKLEVYGGNIRVTGGGFFDDGTPVSDYIFEPDYPLLSPLALSEFITTYKHLPGVASAAEIKASGLNLSQMIMAVLAKTEENVLYILDIYDKLNERQTKIISPLVETERLTTDFISPLSQNGEITIAGDASVTGTLTADQIRSSTIETIRSKLDDLTERYGQATATASTNFTPEVANTPEVFADFTSGVNLDSLNASFGFFSDYLAVLGQTTLNDVKINNLLTVSSISALICESLTSEVSADFTSEVEASEVAANCDNTLYLQSSGFGAINLLAGLMTLEPNGQVTINGNLTVTGSLTASQLSPPPDRPLEIAIASQSAVLIYQDINQPIATFSSQTAAFSRLNLDASGTATISSGTNHVNITSDALTAQSQVIITFTSDYSPATKYWVVKQPDQNEFNLFVNYPVNRPTTLDWLIIN